MTYHEFFEAVGMLTVGAAVLVPFYGAVWEISKARYMKEAAAKAAADAAAAEALRIAARKDVDSLVGTPVPKP